MYDSEQAILTPGPLTVLPPIFQMFSTSDAVVHTPNARVALVSDEQ